MEIERLHQRKARGGAVRVTARGGSRPTARDVDAEETPASAPVAEPPPPAPARAPDALGTLVMKDSGHEYPMPLDEVTVGRKDPVTGAHPDIDLSAEDMVRSVSRRHAKIARRDGSYTITEEVGVANGTFLNGARLATGDPQPLVDGDEIKFGLVAATFKVGTPA